MNIIKNLADNLKVLARPLLIFLAVFCLFLISLKVIFDNVVTLRSRVSDNQKMETALQAKLTSLQSANLTVSDQSRIASIVLPAKNSMLLTVSQIQQKAQASSLVVADVRSNSANSAAASVSSVEIDFDADGTYQSIASFIEQMTNSAPVNRFGNIRITSQNLASNNIYRLSASIFSYWAALPTSIPSIDQPITRLTRDEETILSQISSLQQPVLSEATTISPTVVRSNPFGN